MLSAKLWRRKWRTPEKWCLHYRYIQKEIQFHQTGSENGRNGVCSRLCFCTAPCLKMSRMQLGVQTREKAINTW